MINDAFDIGCVLYFDDSTERRSHLKSKVPVDFITHGKTVGSLSPVEIILPSR